MQKFETRIIVLPSSREKQLERLNEEGAKGWQVVAVVGDEHLEAYLQPPTNAGALFSEGR